ncbi:MAG: diguanylate cyclase domain-containing protein [Actinomycetota bacterium]
MPSGRSGRAVGTARREVRLARPNPDVDALVPRIAAATLLLGGLLALAVGMVLPDATLEDINLPVPIVAVCAGAVFVLCPWRTWPGRAQLAIPVAMFGLVAWGGLTTQAASAPFLAVLPLPFVFAGFTQRPYAAIALAPVGATALILGARFEITHTLVAALVFALPVSVFVGEAIAQALRRRTRAEVHIDRLLHAVRVLAHVTEERAGAQLVASLTAQLLDADAVAVLIADRPRSGRFSNRAWFGHPALADAAPLVIDRKADPALLRPGGTRFLSDASATPLLHAPGAAGKVRSAALLPLPGSGAQPLGVVVAMWGTTHRSLPDPASHAGELLSQEAGRMFQRLHATAALTHDADTDALTELANRRTFARALRTLGPGDAIVIVDLDHFKSVNDRFGHEFGDDTLRSLARCLRRVARQVDCVARYGGEEFAIVLAGADEVGAQTALRRVRRAWAATDPVTTFSSGVAVHEAGERPQDTLRRADEALYTAKESGRDCDVLASVKEIVLP